MLQEKRFFYILGYPRCRSTWFSQFFSTNVSFCHHEILSNNDPQAFNKFMAEIPMPYVGSADTNAISFSMAHRKTGPIVLIYRTEEDVIHSLLKAFDKHEAFTVKEWEQYLFNMVDMYTICLDWYKENDPNSLTINFEDLEDEQVIMKIFKHCIPGHDPDWAYIRKFDNLRITIKRREGMRNGIETSRKNRGFSIEEFKKRHLSAYDRESFIESFRKDPEPFNYAESRLYIGAATRSSLQA